MNQLLAHYLVDVEFPDVSGMEHIQMLQIRDEIATVEATFPPTESQKLAAADKRLLEQAPDFYAELSRFIDLAEQRQTHHISPDRWWWYLDVLAQLPAGVLAHATTPVPA